MTGIYGFSGGPQFEADTPGDMWQAAFDMPMNAGATFFDQAKGGVLDSFYLGTELRDTTLPQEPQSKLTSVMQMAQGLLPLRLFSAIRGYKALTQEPSKLLSEDEYKNSPFFRDSIPWDNGMTETRAAALASSYDAKQVRSYFASKRPITSFLGNLAGQAVDPINYIPIAGPLVRAANEARFGRIAGEAATSSLDAMANTAIAGFGSAPVRGSFGDDVSWQDTVSQIAMAGLIGGAFGGMSGAIGARGEARALSEANARLSTLDNVHSARIALNEAIDGIVNDGEVRLSPNATEPLAKMATDINPARSPNLFAPLERTDLYGSTAVGRLIDNRPVQLQDFETTVRNDVLSGNPDLAERYRAAEAKFQAAQDRVASIEEPLNARTTADTAALVDAASAERLRAIEADLAKNPSRKKAEALQAERDTIVQSLGPDALAKAENDFRIGPTKQAKQARKALATARQEFSKVRREADQIAMNNATVHRVRNAVAVDTSPARPEPAPEGRPQAEQRIAKPEDFRAMAEQYRVDPTTGGFAEEADIKQLDTEGRLTADDKASLEEAQKVHDDGVAYGEALKAAVACLT